MPMPGLQHITPEESAERRASVEACRADLALEGLVAPPEVQEFGEQFIRGELTANEYRQACFNHAKKLAKNPNWAPVTSPLPE